MHCNFLGAQFSVIVGELVGNSWEDLIFFQIINIRMHNTYLFVILKCMYYLEQQNPLHKTKIIVQLEELLIES
jgi:hypothetical protein